MPNLQDTLKHIDIQASKKAVISSTKIAATKFDTADRKKLAKKGVAEKDGSFPIRNAKDLSNAKKDLGRAGNKSSDRAHINERAKALGLAKIGAGGPGSGRKPEDVLKGFGFTKGTTIRQSKENLLTIYHGKGPGGEYQQVAVTPKNFTHVSDPGTAQAKVHAQLEPIKGLQDHMVSHWVNYATNKKLGGV